jgi:outer membrane protein assembly factor BamB
MRIQRLQRLIRAGVLVSVSVALLNAQGRGGPEWTTNGFDAQRSGWLRADARLTKAAVQKGEFEFLWKMTIENASRQLNSLTPPVLLDRLIGYRGFKSLAFFGGSDDRVFAVDTDLARPAWTTILNYSAPTGGRPSSSLDCPGGLIAMPSRRTALASAVPVVVGGARGGVRNGSAVGEPGRGAAALGQPSPQRGAPPAPARGRGPAPIGFGRVDPLFVVGSDGYIHNLLVSNGADSEPPVPFIPPDAKPSALIWVDGVVYTTTSGECGAAPNAVWAMDLNLPVNERKTVSWKTGSARIAGSSGLAFGAQGTIYVALGTAPTPAPRPDSIVALDRDTLMPTDWFTAPGADFNATPIVIRRADRDLIAATANDGRLYLLDATSLGGIDHKTPLAVTEKFTDAGAGTALATFEDGSGRWIFVTASGTTGEVKFAQNGAAPNGRVVAFKVVEDNGKVSLEPAWQSGDLMSPLAPIVVDGMVFAVSSGEYRGGPASLSAAQRAQRSVPAVLHVLDAATGKTMWSSGTKITSFARGGLSAGGGQVYLVTYDNHVYAFGIPLEH